MSMLKNVPTEQEIIDHVRRKPLHLFRYSRDINITRCTLCKKRYTGFYPSNLKDHVTEKYPQDAEKSGAVKIERDLACKRKLEECDKDDENDQATAKKKLKTKFPETTLKRSTKCFPSPSSTTIIYNYY